MAMRARQKPGVVLVTSGPGATNAITGIATAYMDSIPMVVISGRVQSHLIGEDAFQETDMVDISGPSQSTPSWCSGLKTFGIIRRFTLPRQVVPAREYT